MSFTQPLRPAGSNKLKHQTAVLSHCRLPMRKQSSLPTRECSPLPIHKWSPLSICERCRLHQRQVSFLPRFYVLHPNEFKHQMTVSRRRLHMREWSFLPMRERSPLSICERSPLSTTKDNPHARIKVILLAKRPCTTSLRTCTRSPAVVQRAVMSRCCSAVSVHIAVGCLASASHLPTTMSMHTAASPL